MAAAPADNPFPIVESPLQSCWLSLNTDFNVLLFNVNAKKQHLNQNDRLKCHTWITKLKEMTGSVQEARLRNDLIYFLHKQIDEDKKLTKVFNQMPPEGPLKNCKHLIAHFREPHHLKFHTFIDDADQTGQNARPAELFTRSPDKGEFLLNQPVPRDGAFCYLAVISRQAPLDV